MSYSIDADSVWTELCSSCERKTHDFTDGNNYCPAGEPGEGELVLVDNEDIICKQSE